MVLCWSTIYQWSSIRHSAWWIAAITAPLPWLPWWLRGQSICLQCGRPGFDPWVQSLGWKDPLEREMATHSSILAWRLPWTEEPGGLQSTGSQSQTRLSDFTFTLPMAVGVSFHTDSGLGQVTYFGQWSISRHTAGDWKMLTHEGTLSWYFRKFAMVMQVTPC